ncbi:MAG: hypothetical protein R3C15_19790 [Thermoleophilia bacterium]
MLERVLCPGCGVRVTTETLDDHVCELERFVGHQMARLRPEIARFEDELAVYLGSPRGRFELWYAARTRGRGTRVGG